MCWPYTAIFEWATFLQGQLASLLTAPASDGDASPAVVVDGVRVLLVPLEVFSAVSRADASLIEAERLSAVSMCASCFDDKKGAEFVSMCGCEHSFCVSCVTSYLVSEVSCGRVVDINYISHSAHDITTIAISA